MKNRKLAIYKIRELLEQSQYRFSKHLGISEAAISLYESERRRPDANVLAKISKLLSNIQPPLPITIQDVLDDYKE